MKKSIKGISAMVCGSLLLAGVSNQLLAKELVVYGKIHLSGDVIDSGEAKEYAIGSNSSRIGFKGSHALSSNVKAVWKLESDIDVSGERGELKARNRYLGLQHDYGTLIVGYHDTPFKKLGAKSGVFHDTIAERRGILGAGNGSNKFNTRARNSVLYKSPKISGMQFLAMRSSGDDVDDKKEESPITSVSLMFKQKLFYVGVAYEDQQKLDASGFRVGAGASLGNTALNVIYEKLNSDGDKNFDRAAYGTSIVHKLGKVALKAQVFMLDDSTSKTDTGAMLFGIGADYNWDKKLKFYAVGGMVKNEENSKVPLAGSGHGEKYIPTQGDDPKGVSVGMVYKF